MSTFKAHYRRPPLRKGHLRKIGRKRRAAKSRKGATPLTGLPGGHLVNRAWRGQLHRRFEYFRDIGKR